MNKEFKDLVEENNELRDSLDGYLPIDEAENKKCWELINQIVENEIKQETECSK